MSVSQTINRLSDRAQAALREAESFEVLSLIPSLGPLSAGDPMLPWATFHQWPVLGTAAVASRTLRDEIITSVARGVEENRGLAANCFIPRHGIRAVGPGDSIDLVICFECFQLQVFIAGAKPEWLLISTSPKVVLDRLLSGMGVTLEPDKAQVAEALRAWEEARAEAERAREVQRAKTEVIAPAIDSEKPRHSQFFQFVCPFCKHAETIGLWLNFKTCSGCGKGWRIVREPR